MTIIAFDDTDSREGMCTTYLMAKLILKLIDEEIEIIGYPQLVRLNPNIPYKTRGNGALSVQVGKGDGNRHLIMRWNAKEVYGYEQEYGHGYEHGYKHEYGHEYKSEHGEINGDEEHGIEEKVFDLACELVEEYAEMNIKETEPGVVMFSGKPEGSMYERAIHSMVEIDEAEKFINENHGIFRKYKNGRGIIGASAACAWLPGDHTFELISYRFPERFGSPREIDEESVKKMDILCPGTFDNYDHRNRHIAISPTSPCPVLFGIRGEDIDELLKVQALVCGEESSGFVIFQTNQGTDEHIVRKKIRDLKPYQSVELSGRVEKEPESIKGGHVIFSIKDESGAVECTAYEPTKEFRDTVRHLRTGDKIRVYGGVRKKPFTINLEKFEVLELAKRKRKLANPECPECGTRMKSIGKDQGFRCKKCKRKAGEDEAVFEVFNPGIKKGWYEVPVCARRHLAKPLKRIKKE